MNVIVRESLKSYPGTCEYLKQTHGFKDFPMKEQKKTKGLLSKKQIVLNQIKSLFFYIANRKHVNGANQIFSTGFHTLTLILLKKIGIIKYQKIYWWGFFIHEPKYLKIIKKMMKFLQEKKLILIVFSEYEKKFYSDFFGDSVSEISYVPYGDWEPNNGDDQQKKQVKTEDYFFSGGYSNRDYESLIESFRHIDEKLIIVCSCNNKDIVNNNNKIPENVKILSDIPCEQFESFLRKAKAVILPFKYDSGASGQSVMLRCMRNKVPVIVTSTEVIKEYVEDNYSGFVLKDLGKELKSKVEIYSKNEAIRLEHAKNLNHTYHRKFSYEAVTPYLSKVVE